MARVKQVTTCEFCEKEIDLESPPLREYYKNGRIDIKDGTLLLDKPQSAQSHVAYLTGYYCNLTCLIGYIKMKRVEA